MLNTNDVVLTRMDESSIGFQAKLNTGSQQ